MSTEAKHGPSPVFEHTLTPGEFSVKIVGHYTTEDGWAAAGVTEIQFNSDRPIKQRAELLALRSAFKDYFDGKMRQFNAQVGDGLEGTMFDWDEP